MVISAPDEEADPDAPDDEDDETNSPFAAEPSTGPGREDMAAEYIPEREEWAAKTILARNDPARVAALEQWDQLFPECAHHQPLYDEFLTTFMKARTSVQGESRDDVRKIITSMFGGNTDDEGRNVVVGMLADDE